MPGPLHRWYSLPDLQTLGQRAAEFADDIRLQSLKRLAGLLHANDGCVGASMGIELLPGGWIALHLRCEASLELLCQRCLHPMTFSMSPQTRLVAVESDAMVSRVPEGFEPLVLEQDRLRPADLIEDELLLGLPLVPRHATDADCDRARQRSS